jgi:hypothetical protein
MTLAMKVNPFAVPVVDMNTIWPNQALQPTAPLHPPNRCILRSASVNAIVRSTLMADSRMAKCRKRK